MKAWVQPAAACAGMAAGLALDVQRVAPEALVALCAAPGAWLDSVRLHLLAMPWSVTAMLVASLAVGWRHGPAASLPAAAAMALGMALGARGAAPLHDLGIDAFAALLMAMAGGMVPAMAATQGLARWPASQSAGRVRVGAACAARSAVPRATAIPARVSLRLRPPPSRSRPHTPLPNAPAAGTCARRR